MLVMVMVLISMEHTFLQYSKYKCFWYSFRESWNGRPGRQNRLSSAGSLNEEDGIFVNSTSSKLLERAHGILM